MSRLSTHVLDTSRGRPAEGLAISLHGLRDDKWLLMQGGSTNSNGRLDFSGVGPFAPGTYKLNFQTGDYWKASAIHSIFPFVEIVFEVKELDSLHIPLLLSPYGYTTYRGS